MDSNHCMLHHEDELDVTQFFKTCFSTDTKRCLLEESELIPVRVLRKELTSGRIKGNSLIDITIGTSISHLFTISEFFEDITILKSNEVYNKELKKWLNADLDTFDWSHILKLQGSSDGWRKMKENLKKSVKRIIKFKLRKENPTDPVVLPKADCLFSGCFLETVSKDQDEFCRNLKKISHFLKAGGHLIMFGFLNGTFYMSGMHQFHLLSYTEEFMRKALQDTGYVIESFDLMEKRSCHKATNYEHLVLVTALKEQE